MSLLVLDGPTVRRLLPMSDCIEVMADALAALARGELHQPLRMVVRPPAAEELLALMPAHRDGDRRAWGVKAVTVSPRNAARGLDVHQGAVLLLDGETGRLRAVVDGSAITAVRTAAVSAVATRVLARSDADTLAILGAGGQARSHLEALAAVRPFRRARVWSRTPAHAAVLAAESTAPFPVEAVETPREALDGASVVVTATAAVTPILERAWLERGAHVNAVGACLPSVRELDTATVAGAALYVDRRESALHESGDYLLAAAEAGFGPEHIRGELGEVLIGAVPGRAGAEELTVFESLGLSVEDLAAAQFVVERAGETGAGTAVPF